MRPLACNDCGSMIRSLLSGNNSEEEGQINNNPIYGRDGKHIANTKEGFTGEVLIYSGNDKIDFENMSAAEAKKQNDVNSYDNLRDDLTGDTKSNIWTHIASDMEGKQIYDETFSMNTIEGGKIYYNPNIEGNGSWGTESKKLYPLWNNKIMGSDKYPYETTVENIQSTIIVHEWYSHAMKGNGDFKYNLVNNRIREVPLDSHRLAYKNVINFKSLWDKTTDAYKGFNLNRLRDYTKKEIKRNQVDKNYRNLYNKYSKYSR